MSRKNEMHTENLKEILEYLEEIVTVIDKIGSGFNKSDRTASALLLYFNQRNILDKLSKTRKYLYQELRSRITEEEYDELIEKDSTTWHPPYDKTAEEILKMLGHADDSQG
jgi:hypothetical protein